MKRTARRGGRILRAAAAAAAVLGAAGTALAADKPSLFHLGPENIGTYGQKVDDLYRLILWIVVVTFLLTESLLLFFVIRFRAKPGGKAVYTHGNHALEVGWTIVPGAILFGLALVQTGAWKEIKIAKPPPKDGLVVQVLAKQFEWHFRYAGPDGKFGTSDDVTTNGQLHVPVDTNVTVLLRSQDVLHAFFLPYLRLKQDTVPGMTISQWFQARKTTATARRERGDEKFDFEIACAELCGLGHTKMRGTLIVEPKEEFFKWLDAEYVSTVLPFGPDDNEPINKYWPADQNRTEDAWGRDNWPVDLKAKWPKK